MLCEILAMYDRLQLGLLLRPAGRTLNGPHAFIVILSIWWLYCTLVLYFSLFRLILVCYCLTMATVWIFIALRDRSQEAKCPEENSAANKI